MRFGKPCRGAFGALLFFAACCQASPPDRLLDAMVVVESRGNVLAVGKAGEKGCLQISAEVIQDVNRVTGSSYVHDDAFDPVKARVICRAYLAHYATADRLGRAPTLEDYARIWNGGPRGVSKPSTLAYWDKVKAAMR